MVRRGRHVTRRDSRGQGQAHLSAEQPAPGQGSRLPSADAHPCRSCHRDRPAPQGPSFADCLIYRPLSVLPAENRMTRSAEFSHTVKHGVRAPQPDIVVHAYRAPCGSGPQIGLIVSKSVGGAVDRHRVARKLRHVARTLIADLDPADRLVVRALPGSRDALSPRLQHELRSAIRRAHSLMDGRR